MKIWIKTLIYSLIAVIITALATTAALQGKHLNDCRKQVSEQSRVIDSLLTIKRTYFTASLYVTDKSVSKVYGSHNKGTISMPQERVYKLVIDSTNVKIR